MKYGPWLIAIFVGICRLHAQTFLNNGLVGYYPFNGNADDQSGNGNTGIVFGATLSADRLGTPNAAYRLAAPGQRITTSAATGFPVSTNDFTVSFWVNLAVAPTDHQIFIANGADQQFQIHMGPFDSQSRSQIGFQAGGTGAGYTPFISWELNQWYNIQVVRSQNTNISIFRDGVELSRQTSLLGNDALPDQRALTFGCFGTNFKPFNGVMDDIRIYNRALSADELGGLYSYEALSLNIENAVLVAFQTVAGKAYQIEASPDVPSPAWSVVAPAVAGDGSRHTASFPTSSSNRRIFRVKEVDLTAGLVSYYPLDGNAKDVVGANDGVITGATSAPDKNGFAGHAFDFHGTNSWILCSDKGFPAGNSPRTISMWINFRSYGVTGPAAIPFITYGNGQANDTFYAILYGLYLPDNPIAVGQSGTSHLLNLPKADGTQLNTWYHLAFSHDGSVTRIYINGSLRDSYARTYSTVLNGEFWIGSYTHKFGWDSNSLTHDGFIDNVRVYNRALSDSEISALADLGI